MPTFRDDPKLGGMVPMMKTDDINDQAITKDKIRDGNVTTEKLAEGAVSTDKLPDGAIKTEKIADENVTTSKLAEGAVETSKIADQNVTSEKIADQSVDNSKLSPEAVTYDKVKNKAIITEKLNDRAVTTEKVEERAITNPKLGNQSVDGRIVREASLETKHFANGSVTTEKIKDSSVTNEKVADDTLGIEKFDPELRKTIQAATGLPEDLSQMIQDVDKSVKQLKEKDTDLQSQIDDKQHQITANDGDISLLQTRSTQMEKAIKGISASGGASQASAVTYENTESGLDSVTAQGAIDELANKKFNKENIVQEFGESKDKVVSQFALPFREIESQEFIKAIVDAEDHFLFGIQLDGSIEWGKGIPAPIRAKLQKIINQCQQDKTDVLAAINAAKEELSASITALQEGKVDKEEGKSLIDNEVKECFKVIENEEFIKAITDADDKVLFGFCRATGKPYYPLNEMYHVEQNEEFFAVWLDAADHVLLGIRRDGQIIGEIHAVNALKQVVSDLQEKVDIIDSSLKELLDIFSLQENSEYLAVEKDAEGKVLSATNHDGSHYIHKVKSETIPEEFSSIEDPEGRAEIIKDKENRIIGFVDSQGDFHANTNVFSKNINNLQNVSDNFCLSSYSEDVDIVLAEPRIAEVRLYASEFPSSKTSDIKGKMKFISGKAFFERNVLINLQGATSMAMPKKNIALDIMDSSYSDSLKVRFGDWVSQDSFHLKAYYFDLTKGVAPTAYMLYKQIEESNGFENDRPYKMYKKTMLEGGADINDIEDSFNYDALCHPMGFPCVLYWNDEFYGLMSWQLKKHRDNYAMNKKNAKHIHLDGWIDKRTLFGENVDWTSFEIRNPKSLVCSDGSSYDGENPKELIDDTMPNYDPSNKNHKNTMAVKKSIIAFSKYMSEIDAVIASSPDNTTAIKNAVEERFDVVRFIDYLLFIWATANTDSTAKNWQFLSYDGKKLTVEPYDLDSCWGIAAAMTGNILSDKGKKYLFGTTDNPLQYIYRYYLAELKERWKTLRDKKIIDAENINNLYLGWYHRVGFDNIQKELKRWNESPCYRPIGLNDSWELTGENYVKFSNISTDWISQNTYAENDKCKYNNRLYRSKTSGNINHIPTETEYWEDLTFVEGKTYHLNETCFWGYTSFFECKCKTETTSQPFKLYSLYPQELSNGFDSLVRLYRYAKNTINYIDSQLNYKL